MGAAVLFGGAGFIGEHFARHILDGGGTPVVADARPRRSGEVLVDVRRPIDPALTSVRPDLVVNLAAVHREPGHEAHEYWETNVEGAINVVRYCDAAGATDLVFVSSISVYGQTEAAVSESTVPAPSTDYGRSKLAAEEICREWRAVDPERRRLTIVRPAVVFGPGEGGNFARLGQALAARWFVYPGRRDALKASGYVTDLVRSMTFVHDRNPGEITYNFASERIYSLEEICETFCGVLGRRPPRFALPRPALLAAGWAGDHVAAIGNATGLSQRRIEKLTSSTNVEPKVLRSMGFEFEYDLEDALRDWYTAFPTGRFE